jgi:hypothetical protein
MNRLVVALAASLTAISPAASPAAAAEALVIKPLAERKVERLPSGPLFWRIETFPTRPKAQAAAGPWSLVAESGGKIWLFTLGPMGGATPGGAIAAEVGPIPSVMARSYLVRINQASGSPGAVTPIHSHPGSEAFFVVKGEQSIRTPRGVSRLAAGQAEAGQGADVAMETSSSGSTDLLALVMFVVDADRPFSTPSTLP